MLLADAKEFWINNQKAKELWLNGSKIWSAEFAPVISGTGGFDGKTWKDIQALVQAGRGPEFFSGADDTFTVQLNDGSGVACYGGNIATQCTFRVCGFDKYFTTNTMLVYMDTTIENGVNFSSAMYDTATKSNWAGSANKVRNFLKGDFYNALPQDLKDIMVEVTHSYTRYGNSGQTATDLVLAPSNWYNVFPQFVKYECWTMDGSSTNSTSKNYDWKIYQPNGSVYEDKGTYQHLIVPMIMIG